MSQYGETITKAGRRLLTKIIANKTSLILTRARVGRGILNDDVDPRDLKDLVEPLYDATTSEPIDNEENISLIVEYRSDMNGGLKESFWLSEFGIYAQDPDEGEILLYYGTLGDLPQPVNAYKDDGRVDARRFPVSIIIGLDTEVVLQYVPGAYITAEEVRELIEKNKRNIYIQETRPAGLKPGDWWIKVHNRQEIPDSMDILLKPGTADSAYRVQIGDRTESIDNIGPGKELNVEIKD